MEKLTLNEIVNEYPGSRFVFEQFRFDYCCGGKQTLGQACNKRNIDIGKVMEEIRKIPDRRHDVINFSEWPLDLLADYIEKTHHRYVQDNLGHINEKLDRLVARHGTENPVLVQLKELFLETSKNLAAHMKKEELILFPWIRKMVDMQRNGTDVHASYTETVMGPISMMEKEHEEEGRRFDEIARLTNNYTPPGEACATWQYTYEKLAEFEKDLHAHVHLENSILFPRALLLERKQETQPASCSLGQHN